MDNADSKTLTEASSRPASVRSVASSVTLAAENANSQNPSGNQNTDTTSSPPPFPTIPDTVDTDSIHSNHTSPGSTTQKREYRYTKPTGRPPNPNAQPKQKGKLGQFVQKFQTPGVRRSIEIAEREKPKAEQTGIHVRSSTGAPGGTSQSFGTWV